MASMDMQWLRAQFELHPEKTKAGLARALSLEPPAVSKILSGARQIKAPEYILMRKFFGLPADGEKALKTSPESYIVDPLHSQSQLQDRNADTQSQWIIPAQIVKQHTDTSSEHIKSFRVEDNMMAPEFNRDEHVLVDLSDRTPSPPGTFIISDGFGVMLRNCALIAQSDPLEIKITALKQSFQSQEQSFDEAQIIGRVIAKLQWL